LIIHDSANIRRVAARLEALGSAPIPSHAPFADHIDITSLDEAQRSASVREVITARKLRPLLGVRYLVVHPVPSIRTCQPATNACAGSITWRIR
jgi:sugar phosphate isomerase/epimerase